MAFDFEFINDFALIRKIGEGGFGKVFLAKKDNSFYALKLIPIQKGNKEIKAFEKYAKLENTKQYNLVSILNYGYIDDYFYYVMPLADVLNSSSNFQPADFRWAEKSLSKLIELQANLPNDKWFLPEEIFEIITPIFDAVIFLNKSGVVHRDIKPSNILFFDGKANLADFGLLDEDIRDISKVGTPIFSAPTWFLNTGGNPDIYGLASTFYMLISGEYPDSIGNPNYVIPKKIKNSISPEAREQYAHWHRCILRAISENPTHRFLTIEDFKYAILSKDFKSSLVYQANFSVKKSSRMLIIALCCVIGFLIIGGIAFNHSKNSLFKEVIQDTTNISKVPTQSEIENFLENKPDEFKIIFHSGYSYQSGHDSVYILPYNAWVQTNCKKIKATIQSEISALEKTLKEAKSNPDESIEYVIHHYRGTLIDKADLVNSLEGNTFNGGMKLARKKFIIVAEVNLLPLYNEWLKNDLLIYEAYVKNLTKHIEITQFSKREGKYATPKSIDRFNRGWE